MRQKDVAADATVARSWVSRVERGHLAGLPIDRLRAIAGALEIQVHLVASWRGGEAARVVNERHSRMHELVAARLSAVSGWEFATEVTFSLWGERGTIDILAWHSASRTLLVIELKTEIPDPAGVLAQVDRYRRLAPKIGRERGWDPVRVATWVLVAESDLNRSQLARHRTMIRNAFPLDGRFLRGWLRDPSRRSMPGTGADSTRSGADATLGGEAPGDGAGGRVSGCRSSGQVSGLAFLANDTEGTTNGRLGPTKRVRRSQRSPERPGILANDPRATHKRGNGASTDGRSAVETRGAGEDPG